MPRAQRLPSRPCGLRYSPESRRMLLGEILSRGSGASLGKLPFSFEPILDVRSGWASAVLPNRVCQKGDGFVEVFVLLLFAYPVADDRDALGVRSLWVSNWNSPWHSPLGQSRRARKEPNPTRSLCSTSEWAQTERTADCLQKMQTSTGAFSDQPSASAAVRSTFVSARLRAATGELVHRHRQPMRLLPKAES